VAPVRQTNFSAGEIAPALWGRTDLDVFGAGLRRLKNFFVSRHGPAVSRPGTTYVETQLVAGPCRLIPFIYSDFDTYVLWFEEQVVRFAKNGAMLMGYVAKVNASAAFALGDTVTGSIHGGHGVITNITGSGANTLLHFMKFTGFFGVGEPVTSVLGGAGTVISFNTEPAQLNTPYGAGDLGAVHFAQVGDILTLTHSSYAPMELKRLAEDNWTLTSVSFARVAPFFSDTTSPYASTLPPMVVSTAWSAFPTAADATHPAQEWIWKVTAILKSDTTGQIFESAPATLDTMSDGVTDPNTRSVPIPTATGNGNFFALYPDKFITLRRQTTIGLLNEPSEYLTVKHLGFIFYRGRGNLFGYVGETTTRDFVDTGVAPDYTRQPPAGENPFEVYDKTNTLVHTEHPTAVAFYQERRVFAGTTERPGWVFASATGEYSNFDKHHFNVSGEALFFEIAARKRENIQSLLPLGRLLIFTNTAVWSAGGSGSPLDFDSIDVVREEEVGATRLQPLLVDGLPLYSRAKGFGVRALVPKARAEGANYSGVDISRNAQHLFLGATVESSEVDDYAHKGLVDWCYQEDPWGIVWALRNDGAMLSLTFDADSGRYGWAEHSTDGKYLAICSVPELHEDAVYVVVQRTIGGVARNYLERFTSRVPQGQPDDNICVDSALTRSPVTFSGSIRINSLDTLEGKQVYALASGMAPQGPYTVTAGSITLDEAPPTPFTVGGVPTAFVHVGMPYTCDMETLGIASAAVRNKQKAVIDVTFEVDQAIGLKVGQDEDHLVDWRQRTVADSYDSLGSETTVVKVKVKHKYDLEARAFLRQDSPLPVTVLGLTREVDIGGD
jgi:hypothetical protein